MPVIHNRCLLVQYTKFFNCILLKTAWCFYFAFFVQVFWHVFYIKRNLLLKFFT